MNITIRSDGVWHATQLTWLPALRVWCALMHTYITYRQDTHSFSWAHRLPPEQKSCDIPAAAVSHKNNRKTILCMNLSAVVHPQCENNKTSWVLQTSRIDSLLQKATGCSCCDATTVVLMCPSYSLYTPRNAHIQQQQYAQMTGIGNTCLIPDISHCIYKSKRYLEHPMWKYRDTQGFFLKEKMPHTTARCTTESHHTKSE